MDSMITAAGRALAAGDPLGALNRVALRDDAAALALRGIALAQLGDLERAKQLLRRAATAFGLREAVARARCVVAEAEIALVSRDLGLSARTLSGARAVLERHGDRLNAAHARTLEVRLLLLTGRLAEAEALLARTDAALLVPAARASHELAVAGIAARRIDTATARDALTRAEAAAREAGIPALVAEVEVAFQVLSAPAARTIGPQGERLLTLAEVERLFSTEGLVVDACRSSVRSPDTIVALATRPVLFTLARVLAEAWPRAAPRETLIRRAFGGREADESHRARLRVEIGRLRGELEALARIEASDNGFTLSPLREGCPVTVLAPPVDEVHGEVLALLADGEAWSSSALAMALDCSARTAQRSLEQLARGGKVQAVGKGRARRWVARPVVGFPTVLLLPAPPPGG